MDKPIRTGTGALSVNSTGSRDGRVLTTHVGSLPRPPAVVELLQSQDAGGAIEGAAPIRDAVAEIVARQAEVGIDIVSDGEMSKISYATYVRHRLTGFELGEVPRAVPADLDAYPDYRDQIASRGETPRYRRPICRGPIELRDPEPVRADIRNLRDAVSSVRVTGGFLTAASPGVVAVFQPNEYYPSQRDYLYALADAMKREYEEIIDSGLMLQVDCPDLAMGRHIRYRDDSDAAFVKHAAEQVEVLNHALANVPPERVRMHVCWGNYEGPHTHDIALGRILPIVLSARPSMISFEAANPRHAHEWEAWQEADVPEDKVLIPGVIDTCTNYVEHPRLVAQRILRFVEMFGESRVIAGTDCGFSTFAGFGRVHPDICWAKLGALVEGARMASRQSQ
jgi:5-methyltetrahydropteroyltriglutamate--homocysteine methyltransferase